MGENESEYSKDGSGGRSKVNQLEREPSCWRARCGEVVPRIGRNHLNV